MGLALFEPMSTTWRRLAAGGALVAGLALPTTVLKAGQAGTPEQPDLPAETARWVAAQVALDRAGFSAGEIDGRHGSNTVRALEGFQRARGLEASGMIDEATAAALGEWFHTPTTVYTITAEDAAGPFVPSLPDDMMQLAALAALGYTSTLELLAERFHAAPSLVQRMNPGSGFEAGQSIIVPNVEPFHPPADRQAPKPRIAGAAAVITVSEATRTLRVQSGDGRVLFQAPVSIGSAQDPLPKGEWTINGTAVLPPFHYNPELFWDADPAHAKAIIAPGPNNPVGVVWIDLNKDHLGLHGTPEPSRIGKTQSHGCLRLTNWDAMRLAALVGRGARVVLQ
jgi:lipoprotein-anchoring transpeptidase ErfK/SrfK